MRAAQFGKLRGGSHRSWENVAAKAVNPDVLVLSDGGPIAAPADAAYVLEQTRVVVGLFGASSMERLPAEVATTETVRRFKAIPV